LRFNVHLCLVGFDLEEDIAGGEGVAFLDLPARDIALGHGRRKRRHVKALRGKRSLAGGEA
jgi:hypothetical protein